MTRTPMVDGADLSLAAGSVAEVAAATSIGPVRTENQDVYEAAPLRPGAGALLLVADGMGGMAGGAEAARAAADAVLASLGDASVDRATAESAAHQANQAVGALRKRIGGNPGTTLTMALVEPGGRVVIAHAGDSRAYLVRGGLATVLTSDHSWVGDQVRAGALEPGAERHHARRNIITMAVMGEPITPEVVELQMVAGDLLALCSDGFWEPLSDDHIGELLATDGPLLAVVTRAAEAALDAGATDNVTVLTWRFQ